MYVFAAAHSAAFAFLLWAAVIDARERIIPDGAVLGVLAAGLAAILFGNALFTTWACSLLSSVLTFTAFFCLSVLSRGGVGGGDVKMAGALGFLFGLPDICWLLVVACFAGLVWGLVRRERGIPFAPFMAVGFVAAEAVRLFMYF